MSKERAKGTPFVRFPSEWFWGKSPDYLDLSNPEKMVYFCLRSALYPRTKRCPGNNGQIDFSYSALQKGSGYSSDTTISKAIQGLEKKGWIRRTAMGGLYCGANKYELTGKYDPFI